ncbi:hypothetical protein FQR65_LT20814 [Abscondita terminalis]|nr:hypothetical protein FQR65_LT20814 [Abscondita terminalis]
MPSGQIISPRGGSNFVHGESATANEALTHDMEPRRGCGSTPPRRARCRSLLSSPGRPMQWRSSAASCDGLSPGFVAGALETEPKLGFGALDC